MKTCITCKDSLDELNFYPHPKIKDKTINECKECVKRRVRRHQEKNKEHRRKYLKKYYKNNKEKLLEYARIKDNKRRKEDLLYKIKYNLSHNLREALRRKNSNKSRSINNLLGCTRQELITYLNNNAYGFKYGDKGIDIDHIIPTSTANTKKEMYKLYHHSNLQLLPSYYNRHIKKNNTFDKNHFENWLKTSKNKQ